MCSKLVFIVKTCLHVQLLWSLLCGVDSQQPADDTSDFVAISTPPDPFTRHSYIKVKSVCTTDKMVGITLLISTSLDKGQYGRTFQRVWRCHANTGTEVTLQIRKVRIPLADDIAFRPWIFNKNATTVEAAKLVAWMVDDIFWWKSSESEKQQMHKWALSRQNYQVNMQPPYSRPYKKFPKSCAPWYWHLMQTKTFSDMDFCPYEQMVVPLLSFPAIFNGQTYGVLRAISPFSDPVLEEERQDLFLSPKFSIEFWVYIMEYCPLAHYNAAKACFLIGHITPTEQHLTPCILVDENGFIQVEAAGPDMYSAQKSNFPIPRKQWVQVLFAFEHRTWTLTARYGEDFRETLWFQASFQWTIQNNDAEGLFLIGGADGRLGSIHGYMSHVTLYRGRVLTIDQLRILPRTFPMFEVTERNSGQDCSHFMKWLHHHVDIYTHRANIYQKKYFCPYSYEYVLTRTWSNPLTKSCPQRLGAVEGDKKRVAQLLRSAAIRDGHVSKHEEAFIATKLFDAVTDSAEENGLQDMHEAMSFLEQSVCLGNMDAAFTLSAFLNNGVGTTIQERRSLSLLMQGTLKRHRLSTLALGHRHAMGIDGAPADIEIAYMYYKDVGDKTKDDRESHPEDQVATETVRLMDEQTLNQQTDETGDVFLWLKHQAQQGVTSAQLHLAHLYFWGSQGMRRNLQAARNLYEQGAEMGDTDSLYNLGIMDLLGRGGMKKNQTSGKVILEKAAKKKHPYAISALGWIAMEQEKNYTKAAANFEEAMRNNFMDAGYYLGHMYQHGLYPNKTRDVDTAVSYYQWAATRGHVIAGLLYAYFQSKGTPKTARNPRMAFEWARFISEQNGAIGRVLRHGVQAFREGNIGLAAFHYLLASEAGAEVASFNMAWLCEEFKETVAANVKRECQWRHYNLTVQREDKFVDPYSYIKMGDYYWYGCQGQRDIEKSAQFYAAAGKRKEPHALFNLAFMVEEGADIPNSVWRSLGFRKKHYTNNVTLLLELYERCRESPKSEAFVPCSLALYRVWLVHLWNKYHLYLKTSTFLGGVMALVGTIYFLFHCFLRWRHRDYIQLYQL